MRRRGRRDDGQALKPTIAAARGAGRPQELASEQASSRGAKRRSEPSSRAVAIVRKVMTTYRELLARVKDEIDEMSTMDACERLASDDAPLFVDVREPDEWDEGHIPGAVHVPRGRLESRIEGLVPDKSRE